MSPELSHKQEALKRDESQILRALTAQKRALNKLMIVCAQFGKTPSDELRDDIKRARNELEQAQDACLIVSLKRFADKIGEEVSDMCSATPRDTIEWPAEKKAGFENAQYRIRIRARELTERALVRLTAETTANDRHRSHVGRIVMERLAKPQPRARR